MSLRDARGREGEELGANYMRGLKRAYFVLTAAWIAYWLVALPLQKWRGAARGHDALVQICSEQVNSSPCLEQADRAFEADTNVLSADFYLRAYLLGPYSLLPFLAPADPLSTALGCGEGRFLGSKRLSRAVACVIGRRHLFGGSAASNN